MQGIFEDLTGQKFNRLHVLERSSEKRGNHIVWKCLCDCGNLHYVIGFHLKSGTIGSFGCLQKDSVTTHGMKGKPEYRAWDGIINRCTNPNDPRYKDYGARGIAVNEKWKDFKEFFKDVGLRPSPKHSIERVDNNKGYTPGNVIWGTVNQQANNRRNNILIEYNGVMLTIAETARKYNVDYQLLRSRLKRGWSIVDAINK